MNRQRLTLAAAITSTTTAAFPAFLAGAVGVQLREDLDFGEGRLGGAIAVYFAAAAVASTTLGRSAQRFGPTNALRTGAVTSATALICIAAFAQSWVTLYAFLALAGLSNSLVQPSANLLLSDRFEDRNLGFAMGLKQSGMPLATLLGGAAVPAFALTVGWRWAYVAAVAIPTLAFVLLSLVHADRTHVPPKRHGRVETPIGPLLLLTVAMVFGGAAATALGGFLVSSAVESGVPDGLAGWMLTIGSVCGITVRLVAGARADRGTIEPLATCTVMLALGAVAFAGFAIQEAWTVYAFTPLAFGAGWAWPGLYHLAVVQRNRQAAATATGITQAGAYIGAGGGPLLFGVIVDATSYEVAWLVAAGYAAFGAVALVASQVWLGRVVASDAVVPPAASKPPSPRPAGPGRAS